ncbi:DNA-binding response regulator [Bacteroidota bacterium]|nr:DNA-binding response regulator [Bacteroidota bacterium]
MIKAIAIDDEPLALNVIEAFCKELDFVDLQKTFTKPHDGLKYLKKFSVDLLFLDINMPPIRGIEFYKSIQQETMVIFTTAHREYAVESYELNAIDFLLKPFEKERFIKAVNRAKEFYTFRRQKEEIKNQFLFVRADYSLIKIALADILYIEGLDDYIKIILPDQKPIVTRMTMKNILEKLPAKEFFRVHRSFIIPFSKIQNVRNKNILISGVEIPIGSSYEEGFMKLFSLNI